MKSHPHPRSFVLIHGVHSALLRGHLLSRVLLLGVTFALLGCADRDRDALVVYCAHDSLYADAILEQFERETGIPVDIRYDTEATKSLGLTEQLVREKDNPRADVFWNNQLLGTADLKARGVLQPYKGPGYERIPEGFKDPEGYYAGFGARLRVYIVNTDAMPPDTERVDAILAGDDLSRVALANPLYGTTLTHYAVLRDLLGPEAFEAMHDGMQQRRVVQRGGNATVKDLVANGVCDVGWTDTDDFFVALDADKPVAMLPIRVGEQQKTILIPNTVAIVKGTDRLPEAQRLVDYLLSAETELALANAKSRQIPVGPVDESNVPDDVKQLREWSTDAYPLNDLVDQRRATLDWLKAEYLQ